MSNTEPLGARGCGAGPDASSFGQRGGASWSPMHGARSVKAMGLNRVNLRKEYFRVTLDEFRTEVEKLHGLVTFTLSAEAEEFRNPCRRQSAHPARPAQPVPHR